MVKKPVTAEDLARANEKSKKRKEARDRMLADKTVDKGLLIVHTGKGKGKSTAAFGLVARAIGNGMKIGVVQYVKGKWETGERLVLDRFPDIVLRYDYLDLEDVLETFRNKRDMLHVVVTGRNAKPELIDIADLVTEMTQIKHPFREQNVRAQKGIEF